MIASLSTQAQERQPSNKHFWHTDTTTATSDRVWNLWTQVETWQHWDSGLKDAYMTDPFSLHKKGTIISLEGRKSKFKVTEIEEGVSYIIKTSLPLGGLYIKRHLRKEGDRTIFTHEVWFKGLTKGLFAKAFGPKFRELLPGVLNNIKRLAEEGHKTQ